MKKEVNQTIPIGKLELWKDNPRLQRDEGIAELVESIREKGILTPLKVRPIGKQEGIRASDSKTVTEDHYQVITGNRRYQAAVKLDLPEVPCIVKEMTDAEAREESLTEQIHWIVALYHKLKPAPVAEKIDFAERREEVKKLKGKKKGEKKQKTDPEFKLGECREYLKHVFTSEEITIMAQEMANNVKAHAIREADKAAVVSQFSSDLKALEAKIAAAAERLSAGYEMREVVCEVRWDYKKDQKLIIRTDTREIVRDERIPDSERQMEIQVGKTPEQIITDAKQAVADAQKEIDKRSQTVKVPLTPAEKKAEEGLL